MRTRSVFAIIIILLVVILIGGGVWAFLKSAASEAEKEEVILTAVRVVEADRGSVADIFQTNGEVVSASSVDTYADVRGILARLYVELGDYVRANQVIAEVDPSQPGLTYALSPVRARVSGTITSLPFDRGDAVNTQLSIATIGDLSSLQVEAAIPERYISRIRIGLPADIHLEAWPEHSISTRVSEISPVVDPASRTLRVKLNIPRGEPRAQAGMYAEIILTIEEKEDAVEIPADAVLRRLGSVFVFVIENDTAVRKPVVLGISQDGIVEVVEGVEAGEDVVIEGQSFLEDGAEVRVLQELQAVS